MSCIMAFRRLSTATSSSTDLGENDDEAEREERRSRSSASTKSSNVSSSITNLSPEEMNSQIDQCLKLNAANKINDKNAFQLKLIDFLAYSLRKHDPKFSNLQMASACLDASSKIYGYRVDKVHSNLLKIVGGSRGEKRPHDNDEENVGDQDANDNVMPRKKRKKRDNFISSVEALKGNIDSYNPMSMINNQVDTQTSDCLQQAKLPKHANQGICLNLYDDVVLDRLKVNSLDLPNFLIPRVHDFTYHHLCPSYKTFKFLGWSVDDEKMDTSDSNDCDGEFHYDMDGPMEDDNKSNSMMDYRDVPEEKSKSSVQNEDQQPLVDFQDIIMNNPNPDATYEYSYVQDNHSINLVRPSHWRVHIKKDVRYNGLAMSPRKARRKKEIELKLTENAKEEADSRFVLANKCRSIKLLRETYMHWSSDHITLPHFMQYTVNRFCSYFNSDKKVEALDSNGKVENKEEVMRDDNNVPEDMFNLSNFGNDCQDNGDLDFNLSHDDQARDASFMFPDSEPPSQQQPEEAFIGENLVELPKLTENLFIPYSQRAKKIDMRQLKKSIRRLLHDQDTKEFSELYRGLPALLSKVNAKSLSPALAFTSLLHVSSEKTLILKNHPDYADLTIKKCHKSQQ